jgi:tetratricopeptide (TPR) repeat protein
MPLPDLIAQRHIRLLTFTGILAGGTICLPAIPALAAVGAMAASVAGGVVANDIIAHHLNCLSVRLRRSNDTLANQNIAQAAGLAVGLLIQSVAESGKYGKDSGKIKQLAHQAAKNWTGLLEANRNGEFDSLDALQEEEITSLFAKTGTDFFEQRVLSLEDWQIILREGLCLAANIDLSDSILFELAETLQQGFPKALREVLKADFEEGGKAFAGMSLSLLGEILAILKESPATGENTAIRAGIEQLEARQQQLQQDNAAGFRELAQEIQGLRGDVKAVHQDVGEVKDEVQAGFAKVTEQNEQILGFLAQNQPVVREISFFLDTNLPAVENWQGRENDLATVNHWLDDENTKLGVIVGIGGMGKSTLAAKVFRERTDFEDRLWLDLSQRPSYSIVARGMLQHFGKLSAQELEKIAETRLTPVVINCLQQKRFLLVLDNLESVLQDEAYRDFLQQWVGECHHTEILVTTQESPQIDQAKPTELPLRGLSNEAGGQLLSKLGIQGEKAALEAYSEQVQGHPLTLKLVAGLLNAEKGDTAHIRDVEEVGIADVAALMNRLEGYHRREKVQLVAVLSASFRRLEKKLQTVLLALVVLRGGFDVDVAKAISGKEVTKRELRQLERRGLIVATDSGCYEFQPFIAAYLRFSEGDLTKSHRRAIEFYQSRYKPRENWETVADVREYLEVFHHRCELGEYEAAFYTIRNDNNVGDVDNFLSFYGNHQLLVELYQQLINNFPDQQDGRYVSSLVSLGNNSLNLGNIQYAIVSFEKALNISDKNGRQSHIVTSLIGLGNANYALGEYFQASSFYYRSLNMLQNDSNTQAIILNNLGNVSKSQGNYEQAYIDYKKALNVVQENTTNNKLKIDIIYNLGNIFYCKSDNLEAILWYKKAVKVAAKLKNKRGHADCLNYLGDSYTVLGQIQKAIRHHNCALKIAIEIQERRIEANSYIGLGNAYRSISKYEESLYFHEKSYNLFKRLFIIQGEANSLGNLGNAYYSLGRYQNAITYHQQSLTINQEIGDKRGEANSLIGLGNAYHAIGSYEDVITFSEQSLTIAREISYKGGEMDSLIGLGNAYNALGRYEDAIAFHEQSLTIAREIGDRQGEAASLGNLGNAYYSLGRYQEAIAFYEQQLTIAREIGNRQGEAISLGGLGNAYDSLGRYQDAIASHEQSLTIKREIGDRRGEAHSLIGLGSAYYSLGRYQEAIVFYQKCLTIAETIHSPHIQAHIWFNLGKTLSKLNRIDDALGAYRNARQLYQNIQLSHEVEECNTAIQTLETPPPAPPQTFWQKIRQFYRNVVLFLRNLIS